MLFQGNFFLSDQVAQGAACVCKTHILEPIHLHASGGIAQVGQTQDALAAPALPAQQCKDALVQAQYSFSDYTRAGLSCLAGLDDLSFSPALSVEHEPFQGMTVTVIARAALDERTLTGSGERGELGPERAGAYASVSATAKLRF